MKICFKFPFRHYDPAREYDLDGPVADVFLRRGVAVAADAAPQDERAAVEPTVETASVRSSKKK